MTENEYREELTKQLALKLMGGISGRIHLAPRFGKTRLIIQMLKYSGSRIGSVLWVTPSRRLADVDIPGEFKKWEGNREILETTTWASLPTRRGHYDLIVLDEEQCITERNAETLLNGKLQCNQLLAMTGTPTRDSAKLDIFNRLWLTTILGLGIEEAVDRGILSEYKIHVVRLRMSELERVEYKVLCNRIDSVMVYDNHYKSLLMKRKRMLAKCKTKDAEVNNLIWHLHEEGKQRVVVFCPDIATANRLGRHQAYHSKSKNADALIRFMEGSSDLLYLVNTGSVGFTLPRVQNIILYQADSDRNGYTTQKICRGLMNDETKTNIFIMQMDGTREENWVRMTLENFGSKHVEYEDCY
nr:MAG TPA: Chromatin remodeling complex ATPase [Caudoviricetes sp.]